MEKQPIDEFDFLMSIGTACKTRYQIERHIKTQIPTYKYPSCFFDWLISGSIICFQKTIKRNFDLNANEFTCNSFSRENNFVPLHEPTGLRFYHELGSTPETRKNYEVANREMRCNMSFFLEKFRFISQRTDWILSSKYNIGLVYYGSLNENDKIETLHLLNEKYNKNFSIIHVTQSSTEEFDINSLRFQINESLIKNTENEWKGMDCKWDNIFQKIRFNTEHLNKINTQQSRQ